MEGQHYEIHIKGHLSQDWADWLECMQMCCLENGEMVLSGMLADQAALLGVLNKLNVLNLCILSVSETEPTNEQHPQGKPIDSQPIGVKNEQNKDK